MSKLDERNLEWYLEREEERKKDIISSMLDSADAVSYTHLTLPTN